MGDPIGSLTANADETWVGTILMIVYQVCCFYRIWRHGTMVVQIIIYYGESPEAEMNLIDGEANAAGGRRWIPGERRRHE